jgi:hypothetical protein
MVTGVQEKNRHVWDALAEKMKYNHVLRLKAAREARECIFVGAQHGIEHCLRR